MSNYTLRLKQIIDNGINIFDFDYPFYDVSKKEDFETLFKNHFMLREIGSETVGIFKFYLKRTFNEKLPYYNELFKAIQLDMDELANNNLSETITRNNSVTQEGSGSNTEEGDRKFSDTPQGSTQNIDDGYLTDYTKETSTSTASSNSTINGNETFTRSLKGNNNSSRAEILKKSLELQKILQNSYMDFFNECNELFMQIY